MRRLLIIGLTLIGLQAYSQEVRWENITALHYAATGREQGSFTFSRRDKENIFFDVKVSYFK